jgi:hypothetical protein
MLSEGAGQEPGDTRKGVQRIIQLVQQEELPMRFALGVSQVCQVYSFLCIHSSISPGRRLRANHSISRRDY